MSGCAKEDTYAHSATEPALSFSCDTLAFDTVFTTLSTTTQKVLVYNNLSQPLMIKSVTLRQGRQSRFRLNVDGDTSLVARDIRLDAGDSLFLFVQATINPNAQTEPFLIEDAILISPDGCPDQFIVLTAYGRNAVYHLPTDTLGSATDRYGNLYRYSVIDCDNWDHTLPHVIIGYAVIDSGATLNLLAGEQLYFASDAVLWVYNDATLTAQGSDQSPVLFTSLRHDGWYRSLPGQWGHIWLGGISGGSSKGCTLDHVRIENSYYGIIADSNDYNLPTLTITNSEICHISVAAIQADDAWIVGNRLLFYDCGGATFYAPFGGRYSFSNLTSANYWTYTHRQTPSIILSNWYQSTDGIVTRDLSEATFTNCIIYGNFHPSEVFLDPNSQAAFHYTFDNCLVKGGDWDQDPLFEDTDDDDYHLSDTSPAHAIGFYAQ